MTNTVAIPRMSRSMIKPKMKYSAGETLLLQILRQQKRPITTQELMELFYKGREQPFWSRRTVHSMLQTLHRKMQMNKEPFTIFMSERRGPYPVEVQLIRR